MDPTYILMFFQNYIWIILLILTIIIVGNFWLRDYKALRNAILSKQPWKPPELNSYPSVSIILPAWCESKIIDRCIQSILQIDYPKEKFEAIIIAGGPNGTYERALKYESNNVKILMQQPRGKAAALNQGIRAATGEIIVTTDADCLFPQDWLKKLIAPFCYDTELAAVGGRAEVLNDVNYITKYFKITEEILGRQVYKSSNVSLGGENSAFRRKILDAVGLFDEQVRIIVDGNMEWKLYSLGFKAVYNPDAFVRREYPFTIKEFIRQQTRWSRGIMQLYHRYERRLLHKNKDKNIKYKLYLRPQITAAIFFMLIPISFFSTIALALFIFIYSTLVLRNMSKPVIAAKYSKDKNLLKYIWLPLLFVPLNLFAQLQAGIEQIVGKKESATFETKRYG
jgi:cellulose synthase/poly-beta-1,6-N-acetylglucosamine synthase-like glycosyltransferase